MKYLVNYKISLLLSIFCIAFAFTNLNAQHPSIKFNKTYGGSNQDWGKAIYKVPGSDLIFLGESKSDDGDLTGNLGETDIVWMRLDTLGNILLQHLFGGDSSEFVGSIIRAYGFGYIILGSTNSPMPGKHGSWDIWVIRISGSGNVVWTKLLGGSGYEVGESIIRTSDSCYAILGYTNSDDGDVTVNKGQSDLWLVKIDQLGNIIWQNTYGGPGDDYGYDLIENDDGGFMLCGSNTSSGGDVSFNHGGADFWVIKTDSAGNVLNEHSYGGSSIEMAKDIVELNGNYLIFGTNGSNDGDVIGNHTDPINGNSATLDAWLICIDEQLNILWQKSLGGSAGEIGDKIYLKEGYILALAKTSSNDGNVSHSHFPGPDIWIIVLDTNGNILKSATYGGSFWDYAKDLYFEDNALYIAGYSESINGDIPINQGLYDMWLFSISLDSLLTNVNNIFSSEDFIYFNNLNNTLHFKKDISCTIDLYDTSGKLILEVNKDKFVNYYALPEFRTGLYSLHIKTEDNFHWKYKLLLD